MTDELKPVANGDGWQFTRNELDLFRQWFNSLSDVNPKYLEQQDRDLSAKVLAMLAAPTQAPVVMGFDLGSTEGDRTAIVLPKEDYDALMTALAEGAKPNERLKELFAPQAPVEVVEEIVEALEPFAAFAEYVAENHPGWDHDDFQVFRHNAWVLLRMREFRRARTALAKLRARG